tara:strand:- start:37835 stop:39583 length:1749 start_codon:yes stop_codon:yes gene_type:complete
MTAPLNYLKVIMLFIASALLIACHSNGSKNKEIPDINTLKIFTDSQTIYSFNEDTRISTKRAEFDPGENQFIELNTNEDKQGYEYAVYVFENSIYLLNYDKETNAEITELAKISSSRIICGLIPHKTSSKASFEDKTNSNRNTIDLPIITIEYQKTGNPCTPELNNRDTLKFESVIGETKDIKGITRTSGKSENVLGGLVINYDAGAKLLEDSTNIYAQTGFLGQDISGSETDPDPGSVTKIAFNYTTETGYDRWETDFKPVSGAQVIHQASNNHVVIQKDEQILVLDTKNLFTVNNEDSDIPVQEKIDALFINFSLKQALENPSPISFNQRQNKDNFLMKHENTLYFYSPPIFTQIPSNETQTSQNATKIEFDLTSDNTALVIQETNNLQTLIAISTTSGQSTTILSASKVEFYIIGNAFYVNTLELESGAGWQAHLFKRVNNKYIPKTYNNSRFIFATNLQEKRNTMLLLSSNSEESEVQMIKPSLYMFDSSQSNGRKKGTSSKNTTVDFSFGQLNTDVEDILSSIIINDEYGKIILSGINEDRDVGEAVEEHYHFNPSQAKADPTLSEQSLLLMKRKVL